MKDKSSIFAESKDEPTALATDVGKVIPILEGEDAIRFEESAREAEKECEIRKSKPRTIKQLTRELQTLKMLYEFESRQLKERENSINNLQKLIQERLNGKGQ